MENSTQIFDFFSNHPQQEKFSFILRHEANPKRKLMFLIDYLVIICWNVY